MKKKLIPDGDGITNGGGSGSIGGGSGDIVADGITKMDKKPRP